MRADKDAGNATRKFAVMAKKNRKNRSEPPEIAGGLAFDAPDPRDVSSIAVWTTITLIVAFFLGIYGLARFGGPYIDRLDDQVGEILVRRARDVAAAGAVDKAVEIYYQALDATFEDPSRRVSTRHELAQLLLDDGRPEEAAAVMLEAVELDRANERTYRLLAEALAAAGRYEDLAREAAQWAALADREGNPEDRYDARRRLGLALVELGRADEAVKALAEAHELRPSPDLALEAARLLHALDRRDDARPFIDYVLNHGDAGQINEAKTWRQ
jgi:tetratricopeptide (TPR) repeat protein